MSGSKFLGGVTKVDRGAHNQIMTMAYSTRT